MARPGLTKHRKFLRLARAIGNPALALGCLEFIWGQCYESGEDYLGEMVDVEAAAQWTGAPGALLDALLGAGGEGNPGFIDELPDRPGHYRCHDLYDHAPEYVRKRMDREAQRRAAGVTLRDIRAAAGRASGAARRQTADDGRHPGTNVEQVSNKCSTNGTTPAPAPAPNPSTTPLPPKGGKRGAMAPAWVQGFPDQVVNLTRDILATWPKPPHDLQPADRDGKRQPVPRPSGPALAARLDEILRKNGDEEILRAIAARAVEEWKGGAWIKAPQHWFGKGEEAPFQAFYRAEMNNRQKGSGGEK